MPHARIGDSPGVTATLRRWRPPDASLRQQRLALAFNVIPAALALTAFVVIAPPADWSQPIVLAALALIAGVAFFAEAKLKGVGAFFSATIICALVALVIAGPLPALAVWLVPDFLNRVVLRRVPVFTPGLVANVASYALALLAGEGILLLAAAPSPLAELPAIYCAGLLMWSVNFAVARLCFGPFFGGYRVRSLVRSEFFDLAPEVLGMLLVGVATTLLVGPIGVVGLLPLATVILAPQFALERLGRTRSVSGLEQGEATRLYAAALADELRLPRSQRRTLQGAAQILAGSYDGEREAQLSPRVLGISDAAYIALHVGERWDGAGWPAGLPAEATPRESRALAVAQEWSMLTARGGLELSQADAMLALGLRAGSELDPAIVEAAGSVVTAEETFVRAPDFAPRLHQLALPWRVRHRALPALLARFSARS